MKLSRFSFLTVLTLAVGGVTVGTVHEANAQAARAGYKWEVHKGSQIKFEVPTAWVTTATGDAMVTKPAGGGLALEFVGIANGGGEAKVVEKALLDAVGKMMPDAKTSGPATPVAQNGLKGVLIKGTGTKNGTKIDWISVVLGDGKGHGLLSLAFAAQGQLAAHSAEVTEVYNSIRPN